MASRRRLHRAVSLTPRPIVLCSSSRALEWLLKFPDAAEFVGLNWMTRIYSHCVVWPATLFHITNVSRKDVRNVLYNFEPVPVGVLRGMGTAFKKEGMAINYAGGGHIASHGRGRGRWGGVRDSRFCCLLLLSTQRGWSCSRRC